MKTHFKRGEVLSKNFLTEDEKTQQASEHIFILIIKTTLRYYLILVRMTLIKKSRNHQCW